MRRALCQWLGAPLLCLAALASGQTPPVSSSVPASQGPAPSAAAASSSALPLPQVPTPTASAGSSPSPAASAVAHGWAIGSNATPWTLITATGALVAFLIGLFTLVGRERKAPYLINSVFLIFLLCAVGVAVDLVAVFLPPGTILLSAAIYLGAACLIIATVVTCWRIYKIYVRFVFFVDSPHPKHWGIVRKISDGRRSRNDKISYEHNAVDVEPSVKEKILEVLKRGDQDAAVQSERTEDIHSCAIAIDHQGQANKILADISSIFLLDNYCLQYMSVARHPIDFIGYLKGYITEKHSEDTWKRVADRVVVVDAYTPHFGFTDSIYHAETRRLRRQFQVDYIKSGPSYAGLHSASSVAFNLIRKKSKGNESVRDPVLIIYEDCAALADLESSEQYRVFVRHVVPSEKMWGGMFTLLVETSPSANDWGILRSYTGLVLDARKTSGTAK